MSSRVCYITSTKDRQGLDPLYGIPRVKPEVFHKGIHFLCFLPKGDINDNFD